MNVLINWLKKPYFFNAHPKHHLLLSFIIGIFIFLFIYTFKPFGMDTLENNIFFYSLGFGFITFFVQAIFSIIFPYLLKDYFKNENWTIGKNVLFLLLLVTFISLCNWLYNTEVQITNKFEKLLSLKEIFFYTFSISIFPIIIYTHFSEVFYSNKRKKKSEDLMTLKPLKIKKLEEGKEVIIYGENHKENIVFNTKDLVYISSQGNYASFFIKTANGIEEHILRNTLLNISTKLNTYTTFVRCHKSYIINTSFFYSINGNARGYYLETKIMKKQIPVSRTFPIEKLKMLI